MSASLMSLAPLETLFYIDVITASIAIVILYCLVKVPAISRTHEDTETKPYLAICGVTAPYFNAPSMTLLQEKITRH